jgi:hypothetical protein
MHPKVEVAGNTVRVLLSKNEPMIVADPETFLGRAN